MAGDYSRIADGIVRHFNAVKMQQGRVYQDSDWNAQVSQFMRRWQTQAEDTFGPAAVPAQTTPNGFLITGIGTPDFTIGAGRCYVDGLQAELFANETVGGNPVSYFNQPFLPNPPLLKVGDGLVYLDVWEREVTAVQDPSLLDVALGGVDTTTRLQTVWQVKLLQSANPPPSPQPLPPLACNTDLNSIFPPSAGQLSAQAVAPVAPTDPCILPDQGGYRGIENRLYRVEIHTAGNAATARWKWSRENASVVSRVTAISNSGSICTLTVDRIGRDDVLRFSANDWVEIIDDQCELAGVPGVMAQIVGTPNETALTITLDRQVQPTSPSFDTADLGKWHTRLIRWDQSTGVDANGLLPITTGWMALEDGVEVQLAINPSTPNGQFNVGDYWCFPARTTNAWVEPLTNAPPLGIRHHYCVLATYTYASGGKPNASSCRIPWPPVATPADDCCCTVCVDAADHNNKTATIADAVQKIRATGGRICLGAGVFLLNNTTVLLEGLSAVTLSGQGPATTLLYWGDGSAIEVHTGLGVRIEDLNVVAIAATPPEGAATSAVPQTVGILVYNTLEVVIERCWVAAVSAPTSNAPASNQAAASPPVVDPGSMAIGLNGFLLETSVRDNVLIGDVGIGNLALLTGSTGAESVLGNVTVSGVQAFGDLDVTGNWMPCGMAGIALMDQPNTWALTVFALEIAAERNRILGCSQVGIAMAGVALPDAAIRIAANHVDVAGTGIYCATDAAVICDNFVTQQMSGATAATSGESGILVGSAPGDSLAINEVRILGNRVSQFGGFGITVAGRILVSSIIANAVNFVLSTGISVTGGKDNSYEAIIRDNEVFAISPPTPVTPAQNTGAEVTGARFNSTTDFPVQWPTVSGISISTMPTATVQNNSIAQVGTITKWPSEAFGIQLTSVQTATLSGNDVCDVGLLGSPGLTCYGVGALTGSSDVGISGNTIRQSSATEKQITNFYGIMIDISSDDKFEGAVVIDNNTVSGNSSLPLVRAKASGDCLLNGNRCAQFAAVKDSKSPVVLITGKVAVVGNNRILLVESNKDYVALDISAGTRPGPSNTNIPNATVTGNIVAGVINLNGKALDSITPPLPLNVQA